MNRLFFKIHLIFYRKLEHELHLIVSYYIAKEKESNEPQLQRPKSHHLSDLNLEEYSHQNIDRFGIIMDIWTNEVNFLEMKKNLISVYFEAYQNVFDKNEKRKLAQVITNIMAQRVRFDLNANYFTQSYRFEVNCLAKQVTALKLILNKMIEDMRVFLDRVDIDKLYGMPFSIVKKNLICLSPNPVGSTLKNLYMLEFHPWLAAASRVPAAIKSALEVHILPFW